MQIIDVIILANNKETRHYELTRVTVDSLRNAMPSYDLNITIIESNKECQDDFGGCRIIKPETEFNFSESINLGYQHCRGEWVMLLNNDVEFTVGFWEELMKAHAEDPSVKSFSCYEPDFHGKYYPAWFNSPDNLYYGYEVLGRVTGWCMIHKTEILDKIGLFDTRFKFFFTDDDYGKRLEYHGIKHALVKSAIVYHRTSKSHDTIPDLVTQQAMDNMKLAFQEKWKFVNSDVEPKIKFVHLLLDPEKQKDVSNGMWNSRMEKQQASIDCWRKIAHKFYMYEEVYSEINREIVPRENCADPDIINTSKDFVNNPPVLSYGHYGAYSAHSKAILNEFNPEVDALLVVEGDVQFKLSPEEMYKEIVGAVKFSFANNGSLFTFAKVSYGTASLASYSDTSKDFGKYKKIDHFLNAHCYLILKNEMHSIQHKLRNTGWHAWDIWLYWNYDRRVPIFCSKDVLVFEPEGASMIDYNIKEV